VEQNLVALAFVAGMVAAFNPCGFAMLPAYLTLAIDPQSGGQLAAVGRALWEPVAGRVAPACWPRVVPCSASSR
jgi:cytochrome c biogenesis protein CcdA